MTPSYCYFLLCATLLLVFPVAIFFPAGRVRWAVGAISFLLCLAPIFPSIVSLSVYVMSICNPLSFSLAVALVCGLFNYRWNVPLYEWLLIATVGFVLYYSALGFLPYDIYEYGYDRNKSLVMAICLIAILPPGSSCVAAIAYLLFLNNIYVNYLDALLDPVLWCVSVVALIRIGSQRALAKRKGTDA